MLLVMAALPSCLRMVSSLRDRHCNLTTSRSTLGSAHRWDLPWRHALPSRSSTPHVYLDTVILLGSLANQRIEGGRWVFWGGAATASFVWFFALGYGARLLGPLFSKPIAWRVLDTLISTIMFGLGLILLAGR